MKTLIITSFLLDQACKYWINKNLEEGESRKFLTPRLNITNVKNRGMAFGAFSNKRGLLFVLSAAGVVGLWREYKNAKGTLSKVGMSLMAGGGLSNIYDRAVKGEVTDYIYLDSKRTTPIFNLADVFVLIGCLIRATSYSVLT